MKPIDLTSDVNLSRILRFIWQHKDVSRVEIANALSLDKSTVTKITARLISLGLVRESSHGTAGSHGGRRPVFLEVTSTFACVCGIEISPERFVCCLLDLNGVVLFQQQEAVSSQLYKNLDCAGIFFKAFDIARKEAEWRGIPLIGVGVGVPGMVDSMDGRIVQSVSLMIDKPYDFIREVSGKVNVPVYLENDARCGCFSEKMLANGESMQNMLFVLTEYRVVQPKVASVKNLSVGMGLVINGEMYKGGEGSAGEFRSILWDGGAGQFSSVATVPGTTHPEDDAWLDSVFQELARHIAFLVNVLNLEVVYIGGLENTLVEKLVALVSDRIAFQWPYNSPRTYEVKVASLGMFSVAYGAASMVIEDFFALPSITTTHKKDVSLLEKIVNSLVLDSSVDGAQNSADKK